MATKKGKGDNENDRHLGKMLGVWMPVEHHAALDAIATMEYRTKTAVVMRALAVYCAKKGYEWPKGASYGIDLEE